MFEICKKNRCSGCTACSSICPKKCICMQGDSEGFLYPKIDFEVCIDCGLCRNICPAINQLKSESLYMAYAIRTKKLSIVRESTSGGAFSAIAEYVLGIGGFICGATYSNNFEIVHKLIDSKNESELQSFRGSKYVQSNLDGIFSQIKKLLHEKNLVCFFGTPCQIAGLKAFLKKDYSDLLTIDVVCHGVPSPLLWKKYLDYIKTRYKKQIVKINFRKKTYGYHSGTMEIQFSNGKRYRSSARCDMFLKSFFSEISSRPSCYTCNYKSRERCSDISIFDCWHFHELTDQKDDDMGYTNILINNSKGLEVFKAIKPKVEHYEIDYQKAIALDGVMVDHNAIPHCNREQFYSSLNTGGLVSSIDRYIPISNLDMLIERSKFILYRLHVLNTIKKLLGILRKNN